MLGENSYHSISGLLYKYWIYFLHPTLLNFTRTPGVRVPQFVNRCFTVTNLWGIYKDHNIKIHNDLVDAYVWFTKYCFELL